MFHHVAFLVICFITLSSARAVTLSSDQINYSTDSDITTTASNSSGAGINNTKSGTSLAPRTIQNSHIITTGNSGQSSGAYGIRTTGDYNQITNNIGATIYTTGRTGRGVSITGDFSSANNLGTITTLGSSSYGIYISGGSNAKATSSSYSTASNSGTINSADSHGIYTADDYTEITNSGIIISGDDTTDYGIRANGDNSTITNSGSITSTKYAIYNNGVGTTINNSGTLNGRVKINNGTLNISGGSISDDVEGSDIGIVNITNDFTQSSSFTSLGELNVTSGTLNSNNSIEANNITIYSGAILSLGSDSSLNGELSGDGTLNIASDVSFAPTSNLTIGNISVDGTFDLSKTNNLTITGNTTGNGSGIINIGTNNQIISGDLSLLSGDSLAIRGNKNGFGSLTVSGATIIDSNAKLIISSSNKYFTNGESITLINGADGSSLKEITDIQVNNCNGRKCGMLRLSTQVIGNDLLLTAEHLKASEISVNKNAKKIYENLNNAEAKTSGTMGDFLAYLDSKNFSETELEDTLTQLSPTSSKGKSIGNINSVGSSLKTGEMRLDKIRAGTDSLPARGRNFAQIFSENQPIDSFNLQQQGGSLKNGFWVQPFGASATQDTTSDDVGYATSLSGIALGLDRQISTKSVTGLALSFSRAETKSLDSLKKTSANSYQLNFYNSYNFHDLFVDSLSGIAFSRYSSSRSIPAVSTTASANYTGFSYAAKARLGITKKIDRHLNFIPEISASFLHNTTGGYSEKGADSLNLNVSSANSKTFEGRIGAGLSWSEKIRELSEFRKFVGVLKTSYGYNFINQSSDITSSFSGQNSSFNSQTSPIDPGSIRFGAEINGYHIDNTIFNIDYQFEHRTSYRSHFIALKVRQEF